MKLEEARKKGLKIGLAGGVFDIIHYGHVFTLNEAKKRCDFLVVVVASDEHILKKGRKLMHSQEYRAAMVGFLKPVDFVVLGGPDMDETVARVKPDVIIYGYDQKPKLRPEGIEIVQLKEHIEPEKLKSSRIIRELGL